MSEHVFKLPDLGEGTVEAEIGEWMVEVGQVVQEEDVVCAMMTDKAAVELGAPVSGRVTKLGGEPGDMIAVGAALIVFETDGEAASAQPAAAEPEAAPAEPEAPAAPAPAPAAAPAPVVRNTGKVLTSPAIRRQARQAGIDLREVPGTGARGRILRGDFDAYVEARRSRANGTAAAVDRSADSEEIKVIGIRRVIAERMSAAKREIPHFAYVEEVDVTALEELRAHMNGRATPDDVRLTPLPFIAMAMVRAIEEFPQCNAHYDAERNVIVRHGAVHLGIAAQTPDGLKVPVVKNAQARDLNSMAREIRRVTEAARDNTATRQELTGSTITLTSLGKLGGIVSTPVINAPEVGIVGVNKAVDRPMVVDGQVVIRRMMNLSSSFDHRFVDGYDAAAMIQRVKEYLEYPATIFIRS